MPFGRWLCCQEPSRDRADTCLWTSGPVAQRAAGYRDRRAICKVADFGLSKQKRETYVSGVSSQRGTLPWIAPEIIKRPHAVNEKVSPCPCSFVV